MKSELHKIVEEHLRVEVGLDVDRIIPFLEESSLHLKGLLVVLDDAVDDGDFELVILNAHKLSGSLCNLGLDELSMVAKNIEITAASNAPAHLGCYLMRLQRELKVFWQ